ncbi:MAG: PilZ domain-containing protein [Deltaproteobacteria bacterium]|nr:PilZ domain-containing protein [Deltaproteobacteria bacterium]
MSKQRRHRDRRLTSNPTAAERRDAARIDRRKGDDRRTDVRVAIDLWMEEVRGDEVYFRRSCDLSEGGVFFDQSIPHAVGTKVTLRFGLPGTDASVQVRGEVVSAARATDGLGMGVKFTEVRADDRAAIRKYVDAIVARRGPAR